MGGYMSLKAIVAVRNTVISIERLPNRSLKLKLRSELEYHLTYFRICYEKERDILFILEVQIHLLSIFDKKMKRNTYRKLEKTV